MNLLKYFVASGFAVIALAGECEVPMFDNIIVTGDAVENGSFPMRYVSRDSTGYFEAYLKLKSGTMLFKGKNDGDAPVTLGWDSAEDNITTASTRPMPVGGEAVVRLRLEIPSGKYEVSNISSVSLRGSVISAPAEIPYAGNGIWQGEVALDNYPDGSQYFGRNVYFTLNNSLGDETAKVMRRKSTCNEVGVSTCSDDLEPIRMNPGVYNFALDLNRGVFDVTAPVDPHRISVFGSSVANGEGAGYKGYAYMYGKQLERRFADGLSKNPFHISGVSIGGNTTFALSLRWDDLDRDFGKYVIVGLSMGNEGIHFAADKQKTFEGFRDGMLSIVKEIRSDGKVPVVMNNYTHSIYNSDDYEYIKAINLLIHQWDLPSVNTLGAIDDGAGRWVADYRNDDAHPNTDGHREFMYAMPPSLFDALAAGKPLPTRQPASEGLTLTDGAALTFVGEETVHPFTISLRYKGNGDGRILGFDADGNNGSIDFRGGKIVYISPDGSETVSAASLTDDNEWHNLAITHFYARGFTAIYLDDDLVITAGERFPLGKVSVGDTSNPDVSRRFNELTFWRSGMNAEEIAAHNSGLMLKSSLEIYAPVSSAGIVNRAQSLNSSLRLAD